MCLMQTNNFYKYKPHSSFCRIFWLWLVTELENPTLEAGRLLKTTRALDRSKRVWVGVLPRWLRETRARQQQTSAGAGEGEGEVEAWQSPVGILASEASPMAPHRRHQGTAPVRSTLSPAQTKTLGHNSKSFCFLLGKHKDDLSNVNLLCTFKTTFSALGSENIFARTSKIH